MIKEIKKTGTYYTPQRLADYIVYRLFKEGGYTFDKPLDVLEPSVGDGIFLDALLNGNYYKEKKGLLSNLDLPFIRIDAIEIDSEVAAKLNSKTKTYDASLGRVTVHNGDCLEYFLRSDKKYDLIIGNPPYIRRRNMSKSTQDLCALVHEMAGIADKKPKNIWTSFFAGAKEKLKEKGVIAFVLPTDLLQVKYTTEIRNILLQEFDKVEIFTLNWIYFDDIEQDVVVLFCSNGHGKSGLKFCHIDNLKDLEKPKHYEDFNNTSLPEVTKWTNYLLTKDDVNYLSKIYSRVSHDSVKEYCLSGAGVVTAANDYFIVDKETVGLYGLHDLASPMIKKASSMYNAVILNKRDIQKKSDENAEIFFINFPDQEKRNMPEIYLRYIKNGEDKMLHKRYKMLLRNNWYHVPSVWSAEAFFTKRSNIYPKIVINKADAYVTDTFYRIQMKKGEDLSAFVLSFYNTFTFIQAELNGRYYGGGVLELTPNEFKGLPVPRLKQTSTTKKYVLQLDKMVRNQTNIFEILDFTDAIILEENCGLSKKDILRLRKIYLKLLRRRLKNVNFNT